MGSDPSLLLDEDDSLSQLQDTTKYDSSVHQVKLSRSYSKDNGNKENMSMDTAEVSMLSMEPISMKRKKKGGGCNLRKSLAWDRAFLTEEGILDPVELSVISGTCINPGGRALSVITEVGGNFKHGDTQNIISSPSSRSYQTKKATQNMSTSHCANGSGAKSSGCPRPSPTSSLKRPAFLNRSRSSAKELKFSKTAIPKPSMCSIPRSGKSSLSVGSQLQHNQIVQSAANNQTCTSSAKIPTIKNTPQVKAGLEASPSTSSSKLLKGNSTRATTALPLHPSTKICQPPVSKVSNTFLKMTAREVDTLGISRTKGYEPVVIAPVPQRITAGKSMHHSQFQAKKPSGLRMPSPSLGFFGQPKVSVSNQPTLMSFKHNIPGLCNLHEHRKTKMSHDMKLSVSTMLLSSTTENSTLSDSDSISESVLEQNINKFVHAEISNDELPMHGADAFDKLDKVHAQQETCEQIILEGDSEFKTSESVLKQNRNKLAHVEISYNELPVHGENAVDESDKVHAQHETSERIILKGDSEHKINDTRFLPQPEDGESLLEAYGPEKSIQGFQDCRSIDSNSKCSPSKCWVALKGDSEHKINDTGLLPQPEDGESVSQADMEKSIQEFQDCRSNGSDLTCSPSTKGEIISNSAVISLSLTCELALAAEGIVPDKKSSTENHHVFPMESCYQSLEHSDVTNYLAPEVPDCDNKNSGSEVPEDNTAKSVEVLAISGEMKCQAPKSCDSELKSYCFLSTETYTDCSTDSGSRTEVDDEIYLLEEQSHASNEMHWATFHKNNLNVNEVATDLEAESIRITVEESSNFNLEFCVTGDLLPDGEPRQEKVVEVPSCTKHFSLQGQMTRENSQSSQHNFDGLKNNLLEDEDKAEILYKMDTSASEELTHNSGFNPKKKIKNSEKELNKNDLQIMIPKDLVPFSEEWLAAMEVAGEDVLTLKTGAVQNSPPDKSLPEPSPWSPVKRKTNQLGPFDCTKYTNPVPSDSPH